MDRSGILEVISKQRAFFRSGQTRDIAFRKEQLKRLRQAVHRYENEIFDALTKDLGKPALESYISEVALVKREIDYASSNLKSWARPRRVGAPLAFFPAQNYILPEPYGIALVIGTWNFPFQITLVPLVGAIAAGNCAIIKPSEVAEASSSLIFRIIRDTFDPAFVAAVEGGAETTSRLIEERFDYIFFTGGAGVGKIIMSAAARHLTPVTLELGGKSPCIVDYDIRLETAARKIVWGKFFNAGQSCVAVDYLLVHRKIKDSLIEWIAWQIMEFYGRDPSLSPDYGRIVSKRHVERLSSLMSGQNILIGGKTDADARYVAPTIIMEPAWDSPLMQEEIFGPILPVLEYEDLGDAIDRINSLPKPLALYFFSLDKRRQKRVLNETLSGGICINETVLHQPTTTLPFGGRGESGIGKYHGKASFETFSNMKAVTKSSLIMEASLRYPPYGNRLKFIRRIF